MTLQSLHEECITIWIQSCSEKKQTKITKLTGGFIDLTQTAVFVFAPTFLAEFFEKLQIARQDYYGQHY